jgi:hypothetical protein
VYVKSRCRAIAIFADCGLGLAVSQRPRNWRMEPSNTVRNGLPARFRESGPQVRRVLERSLPAFVPALLSGAGDISKVTGRRVVELRFHAQGAYRNLPGSLDAAVFAGVAEFVADLYNQPRANGMPRTNVTSRSNLPAECGKMWRANWASGE